MKKLTSIALIAAILCGMAGCNSQKNAKGGEEEIPTLEMYMFGKQQKDLALVMEEANKIIEPAIGAKLNMTLIDSGAYTEKMNMKLATKEYFDICWTSSWMNPYNKGVNNESYYPLTKLIEENAPELREVIPDYWFEAAKRDGEIYAVPNQQIASTIGAVTMDKKWSDKYKLDVNSIKSWKDLEPFMQQIKDNEPDVYPTRPYGNPMLKNYEAIAGGVGLDLRDKDNFKAIYEYEADSWEDGMDMIRSWFLKGYFREDVASVVDDNNDFLAGKYVVTGTGWKPGFESTQNAMLGGEHIAIKLQDRAYVTGATLTSTMWAISAYSKYPEKSIKLISLLNTNKDLYNLLCYGIEGKHYNWIDDNHIKLVDNGGYYLNTSWAFGNQFNSYLLEGQDDNIWEETEKVNDEAEKSRILSFVFDNSKIQTELSQISTVTQEFKNMNNGSVDWRECFDEYKSRLKAAGIDNVKNEIQRQLDEYAKTQK